MRITDEKENVLYVRMLGGFSVRWNGKLIAGGSKASGSQFAFLLQILIHNREKGVTRDRLEELLFEDRDINNLHHALQSVIYNAKKRLEADLPPGPYIIQRKGVFFWSGDIPVVEDAACFEENYRRAESAENEDERIALYTDACHWYGGEFLPMQAAVIWAAHEARRYREMFCDCVEKAADLLRSRQDYFQMEELGIYAAKVDPLADWEPVTMEALVSMGRYEEARRLYEDTVDYYFNEQGLRPSKNLMAQFERLGDEMMHRYAVLDQIQSDLSGMDDSPGPGGYLCSYPVFQGIYRMVERMLERGGQSVYIMLCTVVDSRGVPLKSGTTLEELSKRMGDAIRFAIRRGDALTQYGKGQYLVLLVNTSRENCGVIQKRINDRFIIGRQRSSIEYHVNSVFWESPQQAGGKIRP